MTFLSWHGWQDISCSLTNSQTTWFHPGTFFCILVHSITGDHNLHYPCCHTSFQDMIKRFIITRAVVSNIKFDHDMTWHVWYTSSSLSHHHHLQKIKPQAPGMRVLPSSFLCRDWRSTAPLPLTYILNPLTLLCTATCSTPHFISTEVWYLHNPLDAWTHL